MINVILEDSAKEILKEEMFSGKVYIKTLEEEDVSEYANTQVSGADTIIPENIKKDVTILGVEGNYEGEPTPPPQQYIYEKGIDSDVEFDLLDGYDDHRIEPGTNLEVSYPYWATSGGVSCDFYINGNLMLQDEAIYYFTLTEDMSVDGRVIITVKKHIDEVTLTYAMGAYADGGSVPDPVTVEKGSTIMTAVYPQPTRTGYSWIGYATTDGASDVEYPMASLIVMNADVTLYPVFMEIAPPAPQPQLTIDNADGWAGDVVVYEHDAIDPDSQWEEVSRVNTGSTSVVYFTVGLSYKFIINGSCDTATVTFEDGGTYGGESFDSPVELLNLSKPEGNPEIPEPYGSDWNRFVDGDSGYLTVVSSNDH